MDEDRGVPIHSLPQHSINLFVNSWSRMNLVNDKKVVTITSSLLFQSKRLVEKVCLCFFEHYHLSWNFCYLHVAIVLSWVTGIRKKWLSVMVISKDACAKFLLKKIVQLQVLNTSLLCLMHIFINPMSPFSKAKLLVAERDQSTTKRHFSWIPTTHFLTGNAWK